MAVWLSLTGRPLSPYKMLFYIFHVEWWPASSQFTVFLYLTFSVPQYDRKRATKTWWCVVKCGTWCVWQYCGKKRMRAAPNCWVCFVIWTLKHFYAKYFDIFVTAVVFRWNVAKSWCLSHFWSALSISIKRIVSWPICVSLSLNKCY